MSARLRDVTILGVHPVVPTDELFEETVEMQWGPGLAADALREARERVREHFAGLYLIEVQLDPPGSAVDWSDFTQPRTDEPESNWQVPLDESPVDEATGRWAFFLHFVDLAQALQTPAGQRRLPMPTPRPQHLVSPRL